jgi:hypothetical protein
MQIKLLVSRSGPSGTHGVGDVIDVPADEADRMVAAGQCEIVRSAKAEKATSKRAAEKAAK